MPLHHTCILQTSGRLLAASQAPIKRRRLLANRPANNQPARRMPKPCRRRCCQGPLAMVLTWQRRLQAKQQPSRRIGVPRTLLRPELLANPSSKAVTRRARTKAKSPKSGKSTRRPSIAMRLPARRLRCRVPAVALSALVAASRAAPPQKALAATRTIVGGPNGGSPSTGLLGRTVVGRAQVGHCQRLKMLAGQQVSHSCMQREPAAWSAPGFCLRAA